jgi:hypothetical protein
MDKIKNRHPFSFWKNILALIWLVSFAAMDSDASGRLKVGYLTCEHLAESSGHRCPSPPFVLD